jgi:hexosaminidase
MKLLFKTAVLIRLFAFCLLAITASASSPADSSVIIPAPVQVVAGKGQFELTATSRILADRELKMEARLLAARLRLVTGFPIQIKSTGTRLLPGDILLTTNAANAGLGKEGYDLSVDSNRVAICAPAAAGVFYGTESLLQLLPPEIFSTNRVNGIAWKIPCVQVEDQPQFAWRGFMLDVSRHFFTKIEVEKVLDLMALYKLNTFHWHLVDDQGWRIQIKKYPRLTSVGAIWGILYPGRHP